MTNESDRTEFTNEIKLVALADGESITDGYYPKPLNKIGMLGDLRDLNIYINGEKYPPMCWDHLFVDPSLIDYDIELYDVKVYETQKDAIDVAVGTDTGCSIGDESVDVVVIFSSDTANVYPSTKVIDSAKFVICVGKDDANEDYIKNADLFYFSNVKRRRVCKFKRKKRIKTIIKTVLTIRRIIKEKGDDGWIRVKLLDSNLVDKGHRWKERDGYNDLQLWLREFGGFEFEEREEGEWFVRSEAIRPTVYSRGNRPGNKPVRQRVHPQSRRKRCYNK